MHFFTFRNPQRALSHREHVFSFYSLRPHSFVGESFHFPHNSHSHTTPSPCTAPGHPPDRHKVAKEPIEVHTLSQIKKEIEDNLRRPSEKSVPPPIALSLPLRASIMEHKGCRSILEYPSFSPLWKDRLGCHTLTLLMPRGSHTLPQQLFRDFFF